MSESPEEDTASEARECGKTSASQMLRETDGGQEQVQEKEECSIRKWGRKKGETQHTKGTITQCL